MSDKNQTFEASNGIKYKITAAHFLGNIANDFGFKFNVKTPEEVLSVMIRLPRDIATKKWKMKNREENENGLKELGFALIKKELNKNSIEDGQHIVVKPSIAKKTYKETLKSIK